MERTVRDQYNEVLTAIKEVLITTSEYNSLTLPIDWNQRDLLLNVKTVLISRGIIGNELKKLALYAATIGVDIKKDSIQHVPNSNIFIGGAL